MTNNFIQDCWKNLEKNNSIPTKLNNVLILDFNEVKKKIIEEDQNFIKKITKSLFDGDFYILKNAFTKESMVNLRKKSFELYKSKPSEFHKMLEGAPDFHRVIDIEIGKKYAIKMCKHSFYFYPWNEDPLKIFEPIYERWRVVKKLMGLNAREYESNTPKDGVVDRIQVVQYPSKVGYLEPHTDPHQHQRLFFSGYMSKQGEDFEGLGFYLINKNNEIVEVEHQIETGDVGIGYSTIYHGVAPVNINKIPNWENGEDGRWFLSMFSNASDEVKSRVTSASIKEKFEDKRLYPNLD